MSTSGLIMMLLSWSVIAYYTVHFFLKVLRSDATDKTPNDDGH